MKSLLSSALSPAKAYFSSPKAWILAGVVALGVGVVGASACSTPAAATCEDSKCFPGNKCIAESGETKCRPTCDSDTVYGSQPCPAGYFCKTGGTQSYCSKGESPNGTVGRPCDSTVPAAESGCGTGLTCYARYKGDGEAFCTKTGCSGDSDCALPYQFCATLDKPAEDAGAPRPRGETVKVCLPRTNCAPCMTDADCPADRNTPQACVSDGTAKYCMRTCEGDQSCPSASACQDKEGKNVCFPIGGKCKGTGKFCEPCMFDGDCESKVCFRDGNNYTDEAYCLGTAAGRCPEPPSKDAGTDPDAEVPDAGPAVDPCAGFTLPPGAQMFCSKGKESDYCISAKPLNAKSPDNGLIGACYTRNTK